MPQTTRVALVQAVMGSKSLSNLKRRDILGFIDREEQVGGGADDIGTRFAGVELEGGLAQLVDVAAGGLPEATRADTGSEGMGDAVHVEDGLGLEGGGDGDDAPAGAGIAVEQPGEEVGLKLVLAGLAGQDDDEGEAEMVEDGILDGAGDLDLVGIEVDAAGARPGDGGAADGGAEEGGEGDGSGGMGWGPGLHVMLVEGRRSKVEGQRSKVEG